MHWFDVASYFFYLLWYLVNALHRYAIHSRPTASGKKASTGLYYDYCLKISLSTVAFKGAKIKMGEPVFACKSICYFNNA